MRALMRETEKQGAEVTRAKGSHWVVRVPGRRQVVASTSPGNSRSVANTRADRDDASR
jgi:predicted RNA binding protein YcfA (HicA-like mRNA interferase family)